MTSNSRFLALAASSVVLLGVSGTASAAVIVSAVSATASSSFPAPEFGTVANLINQGGLATTYTSGVSDFDAYIAGDPRHTVTSAGAEWFTPSGAAGATLVFDLGRVLTLDGLAVWVDEFWGAGTITVSLSLDDMSYTAAGSFDPTDWPTTVDSYGADTFGFGAAAARYVQLVLSGCPQPLSVAGGGCGLGEVAFSSVDGISVPEPGAIALFGLGVLAMGLARRSRRG